MKFAQALAFFALFATGGALFFLNLDHMGYWQTMGLFVLFSFAGAMAFALLGHWLRDRGNGPQLDKLAAWHERASRRGFLFSLQALRGIESLPLFGSKHLRDDIDRTISQVQAGEVKQRQEINERSNVKR